MQCPCGGLVLDRAHAVLLIGKATEWFPEITEKDLPVIVHYRLCLACNRRDKLGWERVKE